VELDRLRPEDGDVRPAAAGAALRRARAGNVAVRLLVAGSVAQDDAGEVVVAVTKVRRGQLSSRDAVILRRRVVVQQLVELLAAVADDPPQGGGSAVLAFIVNRVHLVSSSNLLARSFVRAFAVLVHRLRHPPGDREPATSRYYQ